MQKKFIASYSGGKDSVLAVDRSLRMGMIPVALMTTYNTDRKRSWFHGIPAEVLERVSEAVGIPVWFMKTSGSEYAMNFERQLHKAKEEGAEVCVFGDIDIEAHRKWCTERCIAAGLEAMFPLWKEQRKDIVYDFIEKDYQAAITIVDTKRMQESFLGETLSLHVVNQIAAEGADICGENGEYHTFVFDGPIFRNKVAFSFGEKVIEEKYAVLPILP